MTASGNGESESALVARVADPEFWAEDPFPYLARLRSEAPLGWCAEPDVPSFWAVTKHEDVLRISRDPATFCSSQGILLMDLGRELPDIPGAMLYVDPPEHVRYRRLVNPGFSTGRIRALEAEIRERARTLIDGIEPGVPIDLVAEVTVPFPLLVIADLLGVPAEDWPRFFIWSDLMIAGATEQSEESLASLIEMANYFLDLVAERRGAPKDDLVSMLCEAEVEGEKLNDAELMMFYGQLLVAGNETTRNLLSGGISALADHPEQWALLRDEPERIPVAVEELLRWTTPVISFMRTATRAVELRGREINEGDPLLLLYTSANRDAEVFGSTAEQLDVTRDPNHHVALGFGEHFCLGAALARLETRVFLEELLTRFTGAEAAGPVTRLASGVIAGVTSAPLVFT